MNTSLFIKMVLVVLLFGVLTSKSQEKSCGRVIEGHYEVISQEPFQADGNAVVTGIVYSKEMGEPAPYAIVKIESIKGKLADSLGNFRFEVPSGTFQIEVFTMGHTTLITEHYNFEANTITDIEFQLGTSMTH